MGRRGADHQLEALLGRRKLRDVIVWVCSTDVFLHGAKALLLEGCVTSQPSVLVMSMKLEAIGGFCRQGIMQWRTHPEASFAAIRSILVGERADNLVIGI